MVLEKMKSVAESYIGSEVVNAVVTVPAYFGNYKIYIWIFTNIYKWKNDFF